MPVAPLRDVVSIAHDAILFPRHEVLDTGFNRQIAPGAGVVLGGLCGTNGLNRVRVAPLGF